MGQDQLIPPPNWTSIFSVHPDLDPPGFAETFIDMIENPGRRAVRKESRKQGKEARFPSLKHGAD